MKTGNPPWQTMLFKDVVFTPEPFRVYPEEFEPHLIGLGPLIKSNREPEIREFCRRIQRDALRIWNLARGRSPSAMLTLANLAITATMDLNKLVAQFPHFFKPIAEQIFAWPVMWSPYPVFREPEPDWEQLGLAGAFPFRFAKSTDACSTLSKDDIKSLESFSLKLERASDNVSQFIWSRFSPALRKTVIYCRSHDHDPDWLRRAILQELNAILEGPSIHNAQRFARVNLSPGTKKLLKKKLNKGNLARLNRMLLCDAFPLEIAKIPNNKFNPYSDTGRLAWRLWHHVYILRRFALSPNAHGSYDEDLVSRAGKLPEFSPISPVVDQWFKVAEFCLIAACHKPKNPNKLDESHTDLKRLFAGPNNRESGSRLRGRILRNLKRNFYYFAGLEVS